MKNVLHMDTALISPLPLPNVIPENCILETKQVFEVLS